MPKARQSNNMNKRIVVMIAGRVIATAIVAAAAAYGLVLTPDQKKVLVEVISVGLSAL